MVHMAACTESSRPGGQTRVLNRPAEQLHGLLSPLAIKVCKQYMGKYLVHGKSLYDELHELQGAVIPRCYGLICGIVQAGSIVRGWSRSDEEGGNIDGESKCDVFILRLALVGKPLIEAERGSEVFSEWWESIEDIGRYSIHYTDMRPDSFLRVPL